MKYEEVVKEISQRVDLTKKDVKAVLDSFVELVLEKVIEEPVPLGSLGRFIAQKRKGRVARNLKTGEEIEVPDRIVLIFKPRKSKKYLSEG